MNNLKRLFFIALMAAGSNAYALGNACKNVYFSVDNENDYTVTVTKIDLWSQSEGRWLKNNIKDVAVPSGARDFVVRKGEKVENGENDRITKIKVHYKYEYIYPSGWEVSTAVETVKRSSTDTTIIDPICVADRWYKATIHPVPHVRETLGVSG